MSAVRIARVDPGALDVAIHLAAVEDAAMGAVATFIGTVRDHDPEATSSVVALEYSAHPDAERALRHIVDAAVGEREALVAVSHRVGRLSVGEPAVVIAVATPHRAEAFDICRTIIETIKRDLPVWKRQLAADGTAEWKGIGG